jgi:hypothetical protein
MFISLTSTAQVLRRNYSVALTHVRGGLYIVNEYQDLALASSQETLIPFKPLIRAFARLERQVCEIWQRVPTPNLKLTRMQEMKGYYEYGTPLPSPAPQFDTFDDAWNSLGQRWNALNDWGAKAQDVGSASTDAAALLQQQQKLFNDFSEWEMAFSEIKNKKGSLTQREKCVSALLDCHLLLAKQVLKTATETGEMAWDQTVEDFGRVVDLCRVIIEAEVGLTNTQNEQSCIVSRSQRYIPKSTESNRPEMPWVAFDMGLMPVLFHVVWKCRDARIRLNVINLLERYPRLEFLWDGLLVARIARSIDVIERQCTRLEEAAANGASVDDIPSWTRVLRVDVALSTSAREANIMYTRMEEGGIDTIQINETITW